MALNIEELKPKLREVFENVVIPQIIKAKMKQTAVEWLQGQLKKGIDYNPLDKNSYLNNVEKLFEKAKAMEKEQIEKAYSNGRIDEQFKETNASFYRTKAEQYYNETFKSE